MTTANDAIRPRAAGRSDELPVPPYRACIPAMLEAMADEWPRHEALVESHGPRRLTFQQLEKESAEIARGLLSHGIGKGSRVGILLPNGIDFVVAFLASTRIGAIAVPLSTLYQPPELAWAIRHSDIGILIAAARYLSVDFAQRLESAFEGLSSHDTTDLRLPGAPFLRVIHVSGPCARPWARAWPGSVMGRASVSEPMLRAAESEVTPADTLFIIYTSGSTAEPKAVIHGHGPAIRHGYGLGRRGTPTSAGDRILTVRPFFWIAGLEATLLYSLQTGVTIVFPPSTRPQDIVEAIEREKVTAVTGREMFLADLESSPELKASRFRVRRISYDHAAVLAVDPARPGNAPDVDAALAPASSPLAPSVRANRVCRYYGMTETLGTAVAELDAFELPPGKDWSSGHPVPGVELLLVDPTTGSRLGPDSLGEVYLRGACLLEGMYKKERADVFTPDGFYRTGDLAIVDRDGFVYVKGRTDDMLKIRGANVAPAEIERWLSSLPDVSDAAVVGVETADAAQLILVGILIASGARVPDADLIAFLRTKVSSFKLPQRFLWLSPEQAPRTGSGKLSRRDLQRIATQTLRGGG